MVATGKPQQASPEDLANRKYIHWDADGVEAVPAREAEDNQAVADMLNQIQKMQFNKGRHCFGGTHMRTHGVVKGKFIVLENLPRHLQQTELFSPGAEYPVAYRYSSEPSDPGFDDRIPQPRGLAMKVFNVNGRMFDDGQAFPTQDIEFNSTPALDLADARTTRDILGLRMKCGSNQSEYHRHLESRHDTELQKARDAVRNIHLVSTRWYSQTAYRFGDYIMKYSLIPSTEIQQKLGEKQVGPEDEDDVLHRWLQDFHRDHEAEFQFQVQLCEDLEEQPVEYAGVEWDANKYPWQTIARLVVPKQNSFDFERKTFWEDHIRMNPWHGLVALQPLGGSNRLRRVAYPASSSLRRTLNARKAIDVCSIDEIPN